MHGHKKNRLKNITLQKLENSCDESTQREQHGCCFAEEQGKRREIFLYFVALI